MYAVCAQSTWLFRGSMQSVAVHLDNESDSMPKKWYRKYFHLGSIALAGWYWTRPTQYNRTCDKHKTHDGCARGRTERECSTPITCCRYGNSYMKWPNFSSLLLEWLKWSALGQLATQSRSSVNETVAINSFGRTGNWRSFDCDMYSSTFPNECPANVKVIFFIVFNSERYS